MKLIIYFSTGAAIGVGGGAIPNKEFDQFYNTFIQVFKMNEAYMLQGADVSREQHPESD